MEKEQWEIETEELIETSVDRFASEIKEVLYRNLREKGKGSWMGLSLEKHLMPKFHEEMNELDVALENSTPEEITLEACDLAAVIMMIRDNFGE